MLFTPHSNALFIQMLLHLLWNITFTVQNHALEEYIGGISLIRDSFRADATSDSLGSRQPRYGHLDDRNAAEITRRRVVRVCVVDRRANRWSRAAVEAHTLREHLASSSSPAQDASLVLLDEAEIMRETGRRPLSRTQLCRHRAQYGRLCTSWSRGGFTDESRR